MFDHFMTMFDDFMSLTLSWNLTLSWKLMKLLYSVGCKSRTLTLSWNLPLSWDPTPLWRQVWARGRAQELQLQGAANKLQGAATANTYLVK